jgi:hypothetical protein
MQHHSVFQSWNHFSRWSNVHQDRIGGSDSAESLSIGGDYLFLDVDGLRLL